MCKQHAKTGETYCHVHKAVQSLTIDLEDDDVQCGSLKGINFGVCVDFPVLTKEEDRARLRGFDMSINDWILKIVCPSKTWTVRLTPSELEINVTSGRTSIVIKTELMASAYEMVEENIKALCLRATGPQRHQQQARGEPTEPD